MKKRHALAMETLEDKCLLTSITPSVLIDDVVVAEHDRWIEVPIKLSHKTTDTVTLTYATSELPVWHQFRATAGLDFRHSTGTVTFRPNQTRSSILVEILDDGEVEKGANLLKPVSPRSNSHGVQFGAENFHVNITSATNANIGDGTGNIAIVNDDIDAFDLSNSVRGFSRFVDNFDGDPSTNVVASTQTRIVGSGSSTVTVTVGLEHQGPVWNWGNGSPNCDSDIPQPLGQSGAYVNLPEIAGASIEVDVSMTGLTCDSYSPPNNPGNTGWWDSVSLSLLEEDYYHQGVQFNDPIDVMNDEGDWYFADGGDFFGGGNFKQLSYDETITVPLNGGVLYFVLDTDTATNQDSQYPTVAEISLSATDFRAVSQATGSPRVPLHNDFQYLAIANTEGHGGIYSDYVIKYEGKVIDSGVTDKMVEIVQVPTHLKRSGLTIEVEFRNCDIPGDDIIESCGAVHHMKDYLQLPPARVEVVAGDANFDSQVDVADLLIWQQNRFTMKSNAPLSLSGVRYGDFNGDGYVDGSDFNIWNDAYRARTSQAPLGDANLDFRVDTADIDALQRVVRLASGDLQQHRYGALTYAHDINRDGVVSDADVDHLLLTKFGTKRGDANLDRVVNQADQNVVMANWGRSGGWLQGDMNGDGRINATDLNLVATNMTPPPPVATAALGDVSGDGQVNEDDIDLLYGNLGRYSVSLDLTGDRYVTQADIDYLVYDVLGTRYGDTNLDGVLNWQDWQNVFSNWGQSNRGWRGGDFNGDGIVNYYDYMMMW